MKTKQGCPLFWGLKKKRKDLGKAEKRFSFRDLKWGSAVLYFIVIP